MTGRLFDTDVLVDCLRGRREAVDFFRSSEAERFISAITAGELYAGVREGRERVVLDGFLDSLRVVPVTLDIARQAGLYKRDYARSHALELPDALIAATAASLRADLVTLNTKHFPMFKNIRPPYQK